MVLFTIPIVLKGQESIDGLWKSIYNLESNTDDSVINYTRIILKIDGSEGELQNYDRYFSEKKVFTNRLKIDKEELTLSFYPDSGDIKTYKFKTVDTGLDIIFNEDPLQIIRFNKLQEYNLGGKKEELFDFLTNNAIKGTFEYYDEDLEMEFHPDSTMLVTNSVKSYLTILNKWTLLENNLELFIYLSDFGPMVQMTRIAPGRIDFVDEFDQIYNGYFEKTSPEIKFDKNKLLGIWEQEKPDTTGFSSIPAKMGDREFYPQEVWEFSEIKAVKHHRFFTRDTDWETSKNGELIILESTNDGYFRILSLDDKKLAVERRTIYGEFIRDTFLRRKSLPKPTTPNKYF
ncbi:MAG: hypothetical protein JW731_09215 [Bacteroidales bacterium]|nr:hypothetical protein [Bacteroidales bacterium]